MKCFIVLAVIISCAFALVAQSAKLKAVSGCKSNSDCGAKQCCISNSRLMIATKRKIVAGSRFSKLMMSGGRCVNYIPEEGNCHYASFRSCGCMPGTQCKYYPKEAVAMKVATKSKRKMVYRPGTSKCEKPQ